jgi:hypothetical protein
MTPWPIFTPMILAYFVTGGNTKVPQELKEAHRARQVGFTEASKDPQVRLK